MLLLRIRRPGAISSALLRWRRPVLLLAAICAALMLYWETTSFVAYTADAYVTSDLVSVAPQVTGRIVAVHVQDNQAVHRGDKLVTIDRVPFELAVAARRAGRAVTNAKASADRDAAAASRAEQSAAQGTLQFAQDSRRRMADLAGSDDVSRQDLDAANEALTRAQAKVDSAASAVARAQQIVVMDQSATAQADAELALAEWRLSRTDLPAPTDGTINHLTVRVGDTARQDVPLIGIIDAHAWRIIANYKQDYLRAFHPGHTGWVWLDSAPWHWRRAVIEGIAPGISRDSTPPGLLPYVAPTTNWIRLQRRFPVTLTLAGTPPGGQLFMGADARVVIFP
jgi:multidrug efflux system membrane fusion protein